MKKIILLGIILYLLALIFTRFYNLQITSRFSEDESGFLVRVHQVFVERKITLVGQVNEQGTKVFSSLSVYLLLPFAVLGKFKPVSIFYGASFWGVLTSLALLILSVKINKKFLFISFLVTLFWFPLLQTGRWAWNPNFIPFWVTCAILLTLYKKPVYFFLAGVSLGLAVHSHYYAIFASSIFIFAIFIKEIREKKITKTLSVAGGFALMLLPFIIFDLRHPPGIFILGAAKQSQLISLSAALTNFINYSQKLSLYFTQNRVLSIIFLAIILSIIVTDLAKFKKPLFYMVPVFSQFLLLSLLGVYFQHYFFVVIPFLYIYLIYPRKFTKIKFLQYAALTILIISGFLNLNSTLNKSPITPDLATITKIDLVLKNILKSEKLDKVNIAVLGSPDKNTQARRYRDLLLIPDNISVMSKDEYFTNNYLFVISVSGEKDIRNDPAAEMTNFRSSKLKGNWTIDNGPWQIYLFERI